MKTPKISAVFVDCADIRSEGVYLHSMRDNCWSCAPYWERIALCPVGHVSGDDGHVIRIKLGDKGWCKLCRKHYNRHETPQHVHDATCGPDRDGKFAQ